MKKIILILAMVFSLSSSPLVVQAKMTEAEIAYRTAALELIAQLQKQIVLLQAQLELIKASEEAEEVGSFTSSVKVEASYGVTSDYEVDRISNQEHKAYFERVVELFPAEYRNRVAKFVVFTDTEKSIDAYVETIPPKHDKWLYGVNQAMIAEVDSNSNTELIVHEFGHVLSYDELLDVPQPANTVCADYFMVKGCPLANSYLGEFVNEFWSDSDLARAQKFAESKDSYEQAYKYYKQHKNEYVTDYAALNPEEDFSETFMDFVLLTKPTGDLIKNQKVNFFYQYPDLIKIRNEIRSRL